MYDVKLLRLRNLKDNLIKNCNLSLIKMVVYLYQVNLKG